MPSVSKQQQKFMGIVRAIQKGDVPASKFSKDARDAAKDMSKSDVKKFAKTKHKGLPKKVKQEILKKLKEYAFYHTGTQSRKRDHDDDNNLGRKKKHSGQPDLEEGFGNWIKAKNLTAIVKLSKQKKNATFYVTDDNNSSIYPFWLKNGKFAKATTANYNYDFQRNKTKVKDRSDVIYKYKIDEGMVQPKRGHDYFQLTKDVELDYISGHTGLGLTTPGVILHNTISQFKGKKGAYIIDYHGRHFYVDMKKRHYMDILPIGNKYQKKLRWNSNYKSVDMAPEYSDWKNYKSLVKKENVVKNHEGEHLDEKLDLDMLRPHQKSMLATLFNQFGKRKGYTSKNIGKKASEQEIKDILKRSKPFIRKTSSQYKQEFRDLLHALKGFREGVNEEPVSISMRNNDGSITTTIKEKTSETIDRNFRSYDNHEDEKDDEGTVDEGMFSTIDQIRQDSKNVRDFVKNVFKDRDFMKMKNDKEFIKYLKSIYEGKSITEVGIFPVTNYISGIIPQGRLDTNTPEEKRKSAKLIGDLKKTLNTFWKKNDIPFKIK